MQSADPLMHAGTAGKQALFSFPVKFLQQQQQQQQQQMQALDYERMMVKRKRAPTAVVKSLGLDDLRPHFCKPLQEAAAALSISANSLKRTARRLGIPRWPYRGLKGLVRSKKEVVRGMSTCGDEEERRDLLRQQYCNLSSKEAALRQSGAAGARMAMMNDAAATAAGGRDGDGLDALAEAAQAHSVSNDDLSGVDDESQAIPHPNKKMRPLVPGITTITTAATHPGSPTSAHSIASSGASSQPVAAREDSFSRGPFIHPQPPVSVGSMPLPHTSALENVIQQMIADQHQLIQRISQLESNVSQLIGTSQHVQFPSRAMHVQAPHSATMGPTQHHHHHVRHQQMPGVGGTHGHSQLHAPMPGQNGHSDRTAMYMHSYQHMMPGDKMGAVDAQSALYYSTPKHMA